MDKGPKPVIGIPTSQQDVSGRGHKSHTAGMRYVEAISEYCDAVPVLLPAMARPMSPREVVRNIDGLFLSGGRANVEPHHFGGDPFPEDEPIDPERDNAVLPLIRACVDTGVPIFGSCRGIQELNVALGGSLHYRVHTLPGKLDHRMQRDKDGNGVNVQDLKHNVTLTPGGLFHDWMAQAELMVNSLHAQAVDKPADGLAIEAVSEDGIIEGIRVEGAKSFTVGVQWHAEFNTSDHELSHKLYREFGAAAHEHAACRAGR